MTTAEQLAIKADFMQRQSKTNKRKRLFVKKKYLTSNQACSMIHKVTGHTGHILRYAGEQKWIRFMNRQCCLIFMANS